MRPNKKIPNAFIFPNVADEWVIEQSQIVKILPDPTKLRRGGYQFKKISNPTFQFDFFIFIYLIFVIF